MTFAARSIRLTFQTDPARWLGAALYVLFLLMWWLMPGFLLMHALVFGLSLLFCTNLLFLYRSRNHLVLLDLLPLLCVLGMWVAPAIQYWLEARSWPIGPDAMVMPADAYFRLVIPGVLALGLGAQLGLAGIAGPDRERLERGIAYYPPWRFVGIAAGLGLLGWMLTGLVPAWLNLLTVFLRFFLWIALYAALFLPAGCFKVAALTGLVALVMVQALFSTMFGDLVFGLLIAGLYVQLRRRWSIPRLLLLQGITVLLVGWLLSFKYEYRRAVRPDTTWLGLGGHFGQAAVFSLQPARWTEGINHVLARVNQGNVTAMVYNYVPSQQPFVRGETVRTALLGMLVPRLLWPDKPQAGGVENIRRFLGIPHLHYSINMGTLGEAYVNYGRGPASALYLFLYGWVLSALFDGFRRWSDQVPALFFFLPLVFLPALTVETDLLIVSNHVFKAGVFVLLTMMYERWF